MKDKIYELITLIIYCMAYGIAIGALICNGFKHKMVLICFVFISISVIARVCSATTTLLDKEQQNER